jgi:hypothetical protein
MSVWKERDTQGKKKNFKMRFTYSDSSQKTIIVRKYLETTTIGNTPHDKDMFTSLLPCSKLSRFSS